MNAEQEQTREQCERAKSAVRYLLSDDQRFMQMVAMSACASRQSKSVDEEELLRIMTWYAEQLSAFRLLKLVSEGHLSVHFPEHAEEPEFSIAKEAT